MKTNILLLLSVIVGSLNLWFLNKVPESEKLILVTEKQKECLNSWVGVKKEYPLYGPEIFEGHSLITIKKHFSNNFSSDISSCFYDRQSQMIDYKKIPDTVHFMQKTGSNHIYFYKNPTNDSVVIYGEGN